MMTAMFGGVTSDLADAAVFADLESFGIAASAIASTAAHIDAASADCRTCGHSLGPCRRVRGGGIAEDVCE